MTDLYKEALLEARKLKEIAEEDAKKSIIEAISPYIKKVITKQISSSDIDYIKEQNEPETDLVLEPSAPPATTDTSGLDLTANPVLGNETLTPPVATKNTDVAGVTVDKDGSMIVDFNTLFSNLSLDQNLDQMAAEQNIAPITPASSSEIPPVPGAEVLPVPSAEVPPVPSAEVPPAPGAEVLPAPGTEALPEQPLAESFSVWNNQYLELSSKVDKIYFSKNVPNIVKESVKLKIFDLLESLDKLKEFGKINGAQAKINENKLEFLFLKLKDAKLDNSYIEKEIQKDHDSMTTLKEYAAKLFEESLDDINKETTADAKHAHKVSGVAPGVALHQEKSNPAPHEEEQWADAEPMEVDEAELMEAIKEIKKTMENKKKLKEASDKKVKSWEDGRDGEVKNPAQKNLDNKNKPAEGVKQPKLDGKTVAVMKEDVEDDLSLTDEDDLLTDDEDFDMDADADGDLILNIDLPDEVEDALADVPVDVLDDITVSLADVNIGSDHDASDEEMPSDDEELEISDEEEVPAEEDSLEASDEEMPSDDEELEISDEEEVPAEEENLDEEKTFDDFDRKVTHQRMPKRKDVNLFDKALSGEEASDDEDSTSKKHDLKDLEECLATEKGASDNGAAGKPFVEPVMMETVKRLEKESSILKSELKEANLFIAKNVYFTKFLQRGDLSKSNLTKIVEHLDRAKSVQEAKEIYLKIKNKLAESAAASKKLAGSSSKVTKSGSASLNESVNHKDDGLVIESRRWQKLAGIKTDND